MSVWHGSLRRNDHVFSHKTMEILCSFEICLTGARGEMGEEESISVPVDMHSVNIILITMLHLFKSIRLLFVWFLFVFRQKYSEKFKQKIFYFWIFEGWWPLSIVNWYLHNNLFLCLDYCCNCNWKFIENILKDRLGFKKIIIEVTMPT